MTLLLSRKSVYFATCVVDLIVIVTSYHGVSIMDQMGWHYNHSHIIDHDILYKRIRVTEYNIPSVGVYGEIEIVKEIPCDTIVDIQARAKKYGSFTKNPLLYAKLALRDVFEYMRENNKSVITKIFKQLPLCTEIPLACPLLPTRFHLKDTCVFAEILDIPARVWNVSVSFVLPSGPELAKGWIEFHLDDTPLMRAKRPSFVQRRERDRIRKVLENRRREMNITSA